MVARFEGREWRREIVCLAFSSGVRWQTRLRGHGVLEDDVIMTSGCTQLVGTLTAIVWSSS